jgi:transposase
MRHNAIMETLANLARKVGYTVFIEPRFHIRPEAQNSDTDRADALRLRAAVSWLAGQGLRVAVVLS